MIIIDMIRMDGIKIDGITIGLIKKLEQGMIKIDMI